jgi:hypothetical protein
MALWDFSDTTTALWIDGSDASTLYDSVTGGNLVSPNGAVARAEDKSGNGRHATQATLAAMPTRLSNQQGGLSALGFDGGDMLISDDWYSEDISCFVVARKPNIAEQRFVSKFDGGTGNREYLFYATAAQSFLKNAVGNSGAENQVVTGATIGLDWCVLGWVKNGTAASLSFSGTVSSGTFANATVFDGSELWRIGGQRDLQSFFIGQIGEVVLVAGAVSTAIRQKAEGRLHWKWGLQANLPADHPYKNAAPTIGGGIIPILRQHYAAQGAR